MGRRKSEVGVGYLALGVWATFESGPRVPLPLNDFAHLAPLRDDLGSREGGECNRLLAGEAGKGEMGSVISILGY